jgi:hypothetical protein
MNLMNFDNRKSTGCRRGCLAMARLRLRCRSFVKKRLTTDWQKQVDTRRKPSTSDNLHWSVVYE